MVIDLHFIIINNYFNGNPSCEFKGFELFQSKDAIEKNIWIEYFTTFMLFS